jgi:2'-5' RNA ligase
MLARRAPSGTAGAPSGSVFFALFPAPAVAARIFDQAVELRARLGLSGKLINAERLHVTLHWLGSHAGEPPEALLALARSAAATITAAPIELEFDKVRSFFSSSSRPIVMGMRRDNPALSALHRDLAEALRAAGLGTPEAEPFTPHITLLRDRKAVASQPITPVRWTASELFLVRSRFGTSEYERLGAWPFRPQELS